MWESQKTRVPLLGSLQKKKYPTEDTRFLWGHTVALKALFYRAMKVQAFARIFGWWDLHKLQLLVGVASGVWI